MKIAIYARFSTDLQNDESAEDQARVCREYAQREGWEVIGTYEDKGISGGDTDRPAISKCSLPPAKVNDHLVRGRIPVMAQRIGAGAMR
jgi:hypothetical protein